MTVRQLIIVAALAMATGLAVAISMFTGDSTRAVDGQQPNAALAQAVLLQAPNAQQISYLVRVDPGIPDPSPPDKAQVEFVTDGLTCVAEVSDFSSDRPVVDEPTCPSSGLEVGSQGFSWPWLAAAAVLIAATVVAALPTAAPDDDVAVARTGQ